MMFKRLLQTWPWFLQEVVSDNPFKPVAYIHLRFDLNENTGGDLYAIDGLDCAASWLADIDDPFVSTHLELFPRFFVDVRSA